MTQCYRCHGTVPEGRLLCPICGAIASVPPDLFREGGNVPVEPDVTAIRPAQGDPGRRVWERPWIPGRDLAAGTPNSPGTPNAPGAGATVDAATPGDAGDVPDARPPHTDPPGASGHQDAPDAVASGDTWVASEYVVRPPDADGVPRPQGPDGTADAPDLDGGTSSAIGDTDDPTATFVPDFAEASEASMRTPLPDPPARDPAEGTPPTGDAAPATPPGRIAQAGWEPPMPDDLFRTGDTHPSRPSPFPGADPFETAIRSPVPGLGSQPPDAVGFLHGEHTGAFAVVDPSGRGSQKVLWAVIVGALFLGGLLTGGWLLFAPNLDDLVTTTPNLTPSPTTPAVSPTARPASPSPSPTTSTTATTAAPTSPAPAVFPPEGSSLCSATVYVGGSASCPFALNVAAAIPADATGTFTVSASSPVTGQTYGLSCVRADFVTCTGGVNAIIYVQ